MAIFFKTLIIIASFFLMIKTCVAQIFDVENERLFGVSTMTIKSYNGCSARKGYKAKYYFNSQGQATKSKSFFRLKKLAEFEYRYDSLGNLTHKIQTYSINHKDRIDTNSIVYFYDLEKRIIKKIESPFLTQEFKDFNDLSKPTKIISYFSTNKESSIQVLNYNSKGQVIEIMFQKGDSLITKEILNYNDFGDLNYSLIPSIIGKENEPLVIWFGNRYSPEERYEYKYDPQNRWIEKYVLFKDRKLLFEKRKYK